MRHTHTRTQHVAVALAFEHNASDVKSFAYRVFTDQGFYINSTAKLVDGVDCKHVFVMWRRDAMLL
jgi:hypothetical protein